jgi:hypothetical protein
MQSVLAQSSIDQYTAKAYFQTSSITGGFFNTSAGQEELTSVGQSSIISKEMWVQQGTNDWVEIGDVKGYPTPDGYNAGPYWAGHFYAKQRSNTDAYSVSIYEEHNYGTSGVTGSHSFKVQVGNPSQGLYYWDYYIDNVYVNSLLSNNASMDFVNVGIESNNNDNTFNNGTYVDSLYYRDSSWKLWPSNVRAISEGDNNTLQWRSSYNSSPSITYTHP